ncbi:MAG: protein kinase [bacterium]
MKNPFIAGNWVRSENFFGRKQLIADILEVEHKSLWICGMRRVGKTSLLKQVEYLTLQPEYCQRFISLFWDMQGGGDLDGFRESLLESIEDAGDRFAAIGTSIEKLEELSLFEIIRALRRDAEKHNLTLLLLCDEAEELLNLEKNNPEALPRLRRTLQRGENLTTILTATKRLMLLESTMPSQTSPLLHGFVPPVYIGKLDTAEAEKLVGRGTFSKKNAQEMLQKTNRHPFLLQVLCRKTFESSNLATAIEEMIADDMISQFLAVDFACLNEKEKDILAHILDTEGVDTATLEQKTALRSENVAKIINSLVQLGYLRKIDGGIHIANYFFAHWLKREKEQLFEDTAAAKTTMASTDLTKPALPEKSLTGARFGNYEILKEVGGGGMGVVYQAKDTRLERFVALKILLPELRGKKEFVERFLIEARAASALNHPNVATIYAIDDYEGVPFLCMEYVDGPNLREWQKSCAEDLPLKMDVALKIADGLHHAHALKIIHRDIKPENVLVTKENVPKITDFGLAKILDRSDLNITKSGSTLGTIAYMSPEQISGEQVDQRADIFSFGVLLFELFAGGMPFQEEYQVALIYAILNDPPKSARQINPKLPEAIEPVFAKAIAKKPEQRYQSIAEMIEELKRIPV